MKIALFASGGGSNADVILSTLENHVQREIASIEVIISNNEKAGIAKIASVHNVPLEIILLKNITQEQQTQAYFAILTKYKIDFIVLAGYLRKLPKELTTAFPKKIVNIHPALLPEYGGTGMYGNHVHEAVIAAGETQSGITIHYVDEVYDHGQIIFQAKCVVETKDKEEDLAKKVLALEHKYYTSVIAEIILSQIPVK